MKEEQRRYSKLVKSPRLPFGKDTDKWYPNMKKLYKIKINWRNIVGDYNADNTQLLGVYKEGVLSVACSGGSMLNEMRLLERNTIERINQICGDNYIVKISWTTSNYTKQPEEKKPEEKTERREVTKEELETAENKVSRVTDPRLREKLKEIYLKINKNQ